MALPAWVREFDGGYRGLAAMKNLTSQLIGRFVRAADTATRARYAQGATARLTRYAADVVVPLETTYEIGTLKGLAAVYVMTLDERRPVYQRQREVLTELVSVLASRAPEQLDAPFAAAWQQAPDDAARLRAVIDQVATVTDPRALAWHAELTSTG
jgi:dGTPase